MVLFVRVSLLIRNRKLKHGLLKVPDMRMCTLAAGFFGQGGPNRQDGNRRRGFQVEWLVTNLAAFGINKKYTSPRR